MNISNIKSYSTLHGQYNPLPIKGKLQLLDSCAFIDHVSIHRLLGLFQNVDAIKFEIDDGYLVISPMVKTDP